MSKRRNFLKAIVALPIVTKVVSVEAAKPDTKIWKHMAEDPRQHIKVTCPHCFELASRGHNCDGLAAWNRVQHIK